MEKDFEKYIIDSRHVFSQAITTQSHELSLHVRTEVDSFLIAYDQLFHKLKDLSDKIKYTLSKENPIKEYYKGKIKYGWELSPSIEDAMSFNSEEEAVEYNRKHLYGEYKVELSIK